MSNDQDSAEVRNVATGNELLMEPEFFESVPPGQERGVALKKLERISAASWRRWQPEQLRLYCDSEECVGYRYFGAETVHSLSNGVLASEFVTFICRNCRKSTKRYAVTINVRADGTASMRKFGEFPEFGPPNSPKLLSITGAERQIFLKGRRCENQGLGIAAFAYYRRVVENQKAKIIGEILRVATKLEADPLLLADLEAAKKETQFSAAIGRIKHALPSVLLINGHNPLTLLHSALSEGLHGASDEDCLELATSIRVVLTELVERIGTAVQEEAELKAAVHRLINAGGKK